jgi:hypothetical protein
MSHNGPTNAPPTLGPAEPPKRRADAVPYISYKSLLATSRAVRHERLELQGQNAEGKIINQVVHDLVLTFAGGAEDLKRDNLGERKKKLRYKVGKDAKEGQRLLMLDLRRAKTDFQYNQILVSFLQSIRDAQMGVEYEHVHDCQNAKVQCRECGGNGADYPGEGDKPCPRCKGRGAEPCTFQWQPHLTSPTDPVCPCNPQLGDLNTAVNPPTRFVIHNGEEQPAQ